MRGGFSKVCFIVIWKKKKFHPYIQPGYWFKAQFTSVFQKTFPDCPSPQSLPFLSSFCSSSKAPHL